MSEIRLLHIKPERLLAYRCRRGELLLERVFEAQTIELEQFAAYLANHTQAIFHVFIDQADESHVIESIPGLRGGDRKALIARKQAQLFPDAELLMCCSLGRKKDERANEKLLLSAISTDPQLETWLQSIKDAAVPLAGVYTPALLAGRLLKKLGHKSAHCLLFSIQDGMAHEFCLRQGKTIFSRLSPWQGDHVPEAENLRQYLSNRHLIERGAPLPVYIIAPQQEIAAIKQDCRDDERLAFICIDNQSAAQQIKCKTLLDSNSTLFLHLLADTAPHRQYATPELRHDFFLWRFGKFLNALAITALLCAIVLASIRLHHAHELRQESMSLSLEEVAAIHKHAAITNAFPKLDIDHDTLRQLTRQYADQRKRQRQPNTAYQYLSAALEQSPEIGPESIEWTIDKDEIIIFKGLIQADQPPSARQTLQGLERFTKRLSADPAYTARVLQQPVNMNPAQVLQGGDNEAAADPGGHFAIQITHRVRL